MGEDSFQNSCLRLRTSQSNSVTLSVCDLSCVGRMSVDINSDLNM